LPSAVASWARTTSARGSVGTSSGRHRRRRRHPSGCRVTGSRGRPTRRGPRGPWWSRA
jgi:hypothetical protein